MRSLAFISEKGGVGKSTSVLNVAACLGRRGERVLVVDSDPQGNSSFVLLKGQAPRRPTLFEVLTTDVKAAAAIVPTHFENVSVLPSDHTLADANVVLAGELGRERRLALALEEDEVYRSFDVVLVDTSPTRSLLTTNVLNFVGEVFVPMAPSVFGALGLAQIQNDVRQVTRFLDNRGLRLAGVFLTMLEHNRVSRDIEAQLREALGALVMTTSVPRSVRFEECHARFTSIFQHAPGSSGALAYEKLVEEMFHGHGTGTTKRHRHPRRDSSADHAA